MHKDPFYKSLGYAISGIIQCIQKERNIKIDIDDSVVEYISNVGFDDSYGARPLRRAVQSKIEDKFAEELLDGNIKDGDHIKLMAKDDKVLMLSK